MNNKNSKILDEKEKLVCQDCYYKANHITALGSHISRKHKKKINVKEYYDKYFKIDETEGMCLNCNKPTNFKSLGRGYHTFCSLSCCSKSKITKKKKEKTCQEKYGVSYYTNREKFVETCQEKYGVDNVFQTESVIETCHETKLNKYGDSGYTNVEKRIETVKNNPEMVKQRTKKIKKRALERAIENVNNTIKEKDLNIEVYEYKHHNHMFFKCFDCNDIFDIQSQMFVHRVKENKQICNICNPYHPNDSQPQKDIREFISQYYEDSVISNTKKIISPLELDIYLPDIKLAIEFNGVYFHNECHVDKEYHLEKTQDCEKMGIHLIHIWEDDWTLKPDIIKSRLLNLLGKSKVIYARKCEIKEVSFNDAKVFLNDSHIQGNCVSKIRIGLYYEDELVSLMTFGNLRRNLGYKNTKENTYELLRFCNILNHSVVGGANRLFKYFINTYNPIEIISYADRCWTMNNDNTLYDKLEFKLNSVTQVNYSYIVNNLRENRFKYRKSELVNQGYDKNKTEHQIMQERNIFRIYNCGNLKYTWNMKSMMKVVFYTLLKNHQND